MFNNREVQKYIFSIFALHTRITSANLKKKKNLIISSTGGWGGLLSLNISYTYSMVCGFK